MSNWSYSTWSMGLCSVLLTATFAHADNATGAGAASTEVTSSANDESKVASQVASFAVTQLKDSPAVVTVITGEDIRNSGARDLIDVLYMVPGYFLGVDTEGIVGPGFRGLWGHEGKILLIIDGKEMNELLYSNMQLGNEFPVELIERVEVVRGPGSVIYGGSAELSVINVVTRGLQGSTDLLVSGTYGQMTGAPSFAHGYARRSLTASGRYVVDDVPGLSTFASVSIGEGQRSVRDYVDNDGGSATMAGQSALNPAVIQAGVGYRDVQASFLYHHMATTDIDSGGTVLTSPLPVSFDSYHGELIGTFRPTSRLEIVPRFNVTYQRPWRAPEMNEFFFDKSVRRLRGRLLARWAALDELQVTVGGDAIFDDANLLAPAGLGYQTAYAGLDHVAYQTFGAYAEVLSENRVLNVAAGARYDHHSTLGGALVPRFVLSRSFGPVNLKGLFSLSFRVPSVENISLGLNLRPERTTIYEFEASVDLSPLQRFSLNLYDMSISAPIAYTIDQQTNVEGYENLGRQGTRGVEASYRIRGRLGRLEANYSFYVPTAYDNTEVYTVPDHTNQFLGAPAHKAAFTATVKPWEWLGISPTAIVLGQRYTRTADAMGVQTAVALPAQVLANLYVYTKDVGVTGLTVGLGLYNMFGTDYRFVRPYNAEDHAPLPGLDREVMLRVGYLWEPTSSEP